MTEIERMGDLRRMERVLTHLHAECEAGKTPRCPIIETLGGSRAPVSGTDH